MTKASHPIQKLSFMKKLLVFLFLSLFVCSVSASDEIVKLIKPKGSPLALKVLKTHEEYYAMFTGEIWVAGTLIAEWVDGTDETNYESPDYVLVPDAKSIKKLPYFTIKDPPYYLRYPVTTIDIENGSEAIKLAAGTKRSELLFNKQLKVLKVTGSFLLKSYSVGVDCDASWARGSIQQVNIPDPARVARINSPEHC